MCRSLLALCLSLPLLAAPPDPAVVSSAADCLYDTLGALYRRSSATDTQYYDAGLWRYKDCACISALGGPASAAAALARYYAGQPQPTDPLARLTRAERIDWLRYLAVESNERLLRDYLRPDGALCGTAEHEQSPEICSKFFGCELGSALLDLGADAPATVREHWRGVLTGFVEFLLRNGNLTDGTPGHRNWYTNGNIELGEAELLWLTFKATGEPRYRDLFELQLAFTLDPPQARWPGFGLRYSRTPQRPDGADGAGYLAELGSGPAPGYDGSYTGVQLDIACRLYLHSRDPRVLRLVHLLLNQLLDHRDPTAKPESWILDLTGGSRRNYKAPLLSPGLAVAAWLGGRDDLAPLVASQWAVVEGQYRAMAFGNWNSPNLYRGLGNEVAVLLDAGVLAAAKEKAAAR